MQPGFLFPQPFVRGDDITGTILAAVDEIRDPFAAIVGKAGERRIAEEDKGEFQIADFRFQIGGIPVRERVSQFDANSPRLLKGKTRVG